MFFLWNKKKGIIQNLFTIAFEYFIEQKINAKEDKLNFYFINQQLIMLSIWMVNIFCVFEELVKISWQIVINCIQMPADFDYVFELIHFGVCCVCWCAHVLWSVWILSAHNSIFPFKTSATKLKIQICICILNFAFSKYVYVCFFLPEFELTNIISLNIKITQIRWDVDIAKYTLGIS